MVFASYLANEREFREDFRASSRRFVSRAACHLVRTGYRWSISGNVTDASGAAVPNAKGTITDCNRAMWRRHETLRRKNNLLNS
jgi:hypothetical protein